MDIENNDSHVSISFMTTALEGGERSAARPGRNLPPVPILQKAGWAPELVWTVENLVPNRIIFNFISYYNVLYIITVGSLLVPLSNATV